MKRNIISFILTAFIILISGQFVFANDVSVFLKRDLNFIHSGENKLYSYERTKSKAMTAAHIKRFAEKLIAYTNSSLILDETKMEKVDDRIFFRDSDEVNSTAHFDIDPIAGSFIFNKEMKNYYREEDSEGLPDQSYAPSLAQKHLETLALLPENFRNEMILKHIGGIRMATIKKDGVTVDYDKLVTVVFSRRLNGIPVKGASRIVVRMGIDGELVGIVWNWPELNKQEVLTQNIIKGKNRGTQIKRQLQSLYADSKVETISIHEVKIVMYDDGKGIIEPAMFVKGKLRQKDGFEYHADWMIPLLKNPKGKYSILEKVPVYPNNPETDPKKEMGNNFIEDGTYDDEIE